MRDPTDIWLELSDYSGPLDLFVTLVMRRAIDLRDVELLELVEACVQTLRQERADLDSTTDWLTISSSLLELKSRLMLPLDEDELGPPEPDPSLEELLAGMLETMRFTAAAGYLGGLLAREAGHRYRQAPPPDWVRRGEGVTLDPQRARAQFRPERLGRAIGRLLTVPERIDVRHLLAPRISVKERAAVVTDALQAHGGRCTLDDVVTGQDDRATVAVTVWAMLELYKSGEVDWEQPEPLGEITITAPSPLAPQPQALPAPTAS
ncbi:chromosome segregation protein ScpA [Conexibacter sp. W3-3-2]|uniref:segregation and condensation protein A n=1 Tax=Conexibacter sp. W3-3-2 TaxID=2675227 RepID=UPI0012B9B491|nr:segregation/condensation protein A [Conexibacter sp. W3-3-2]MTD47360.1 chromosome segregation protein ScpA [Conexibacter sp. W3-3-2]